MFKSRYRILGPRMAGAGARPWPASGSCHGPVFGGQDKAGLGVDWCHSWGLAWYASVLHPGWAAQTTEPTVARPSGWSARCGCQQVARPAASLLGVQVAVPSCVLTWPSLCERVRTPPSYKDTRPMGSGPLHTTCFTSITSMKSLFNYSPCWGRGVSTRP